MRGMQREQWKTEETQTKQLLFLNLSLKQLVFIYSIITSVWTSIVWIYWQNYAKKKGK